MKVKNITSGLLVGLALVFGLVGQVSATLITTDAELTVTSASGNFGGLPAVGDTFGVSFTYEDSLPATRGNAHSAIYDGAYSSLDLSALGINGDFQNPVFNFVSVINDDPNNLVDAMGFLWAGDNSNPTFFSPFFTVSSLLLSLEDSSQSVFSDTQLPSMVDLVSFDTRRLQLNLVGGSIQGTLSPVDQAASVPAPASLPLLAFGLLGLFATRFKRKAA